ncbi:hypothetical protein [Chloroflexus sp.]|uniref:hypothetical protein n=1 Tax=Chloroflexus sp. TaxID=1904827 RepID=UPI002638897A|nr:hypothetical protein [uncultured Chloroflexus sp.]
MQHLKSVIALGLLPLAGWWWFESNVFITAWLLGHSEGFQRFVIWMISTLQSSGYVTIIVLGVVYLLSSLIELIWWPTGGMAKRWGVTAVIFWLVVVGLEAIGIFNGYSVRYFGMFAVDGQPPPEWGLWLSGVPLALLFAAGPEGVIRWALITIATWSRQIFFRQAPAREG